MKKEAKYTLLLLSIITSILFACKKTGVIGNDISFVAAYNASTGSTGINFLIDGQAINTSILAQGQKSTYYGVYEGMWNTEVVPTGSTTTFKRDLTFTAGERNSLFVIGQKDTLDYFIIKDDLNVRDLNKVKVKFLNLCRNSGTLTLEVQLLGTISEFPGYAYKAFSDYQNFNGGLIYTLTMRNTSTKAVVGTPITAEFTQGKIYTVWARGSVNATLQIERPTIQISEVN
jgi:hypothetical protein